MRLYYAVGVYVGTQADAKRLDKDFTQVEVPVDKDGLMAFLNRAKIAPANAVGAPPAITAPEPEPEPDDIADLLGEEPAPSPPVSRAADMSASGILSRMDNPDIRVDDVVEAIGKSKMHALKRFAGAIAMRFQELAS